MTRDAPEPWIGAPHSEEREADKDASRSPRIARGASSNLWAWALATMIVPQAMVIVPALERGSASDVAASLITIAMGAAAGALLAGLDQSHLRAHGYTAATPWAWGAFPAVYLAIRGYRAVRENMEGLGPAWLHGGMIVLIFACLTILEPWIRAAIALLDRAQSFG